MKNNYPPDARMQDYFNEIEANDIYEAGLNDAIDEALDYNPSTKDDNLMIVWDQDDGVDYHEQFLPYPTYYNTNEPNFVRKISDDLDNHFIDPALIGKFQQNLKIYEASDLLEELLKPSGLVFGGLSRVDLDNAYVSYFS